VPIVSTPAPAATPAATPLAPATSAEGKAKLAAELPNPDKKSDEPAKVSNERCAQLLAQGNLALAQAEGCGGGDSPIYSGSIVNYSQVFAPASASLPYNDRFNAMQLYLAPRIRLAPKWAATADITLGYELTKPDDTTYAHELYRTDTRLSVTGLLGTYKGFAFTAGGRLTLPTSKSSIAARQVGTGAVFNVVRQFEFLDGLAFSVGGAWAHFWSRNLTKQYQDAPTVQGTNAQNIPLSSGNRLTQDSLRATGSASLNFTEEWNLQLSYLYGWALAKRFPSDTVDFGADQPGINGPQNVSGNPLADNRWSKFGYLSLSGSYQPITWFIASVQMSTGVCYNAASGSQSQFGGCGPGFKTASFASRNPIANKYTSIALQFTIPIDAFVAAFTKKGANESTTARAKAKKSSL
jgi:hypothetical protein